MSDYMYLPKISGDVESSLTITNIVTNSRGPSPVRSEFDLLVLEPIRGSQGWKAVRRLNFDGAEVKQLSSSDYSLDVGELVVVLPVDKSNEYRFELESLPIPKSRSVDSSLCTSRGSLRFHYAGSSSSFQSEYPTSMVQRNSGNMTSFRIPDRELDNNKTHLACFINLSNTENSNHKEVEIIVLNEKRLNFDRLNFVRNACTNYEIPLHLHKTQLTFTINGCVAIPLFVSLCTSPIKQITVEHSHPPSEMFWRQKSQRLGVGRIRQVWNDK